MNSKKAINSFAVYLSCCNLKVQFCYLLMALESLLSGILFSLIYKQETLWASN